MAEKATDRRVQKTRKLLQDALIELIAEKGYAAVSIQELLDRANVGRSTFYLHFDHKDELLHSCFEELNNRLNQHYSELLHSGRQVNDDTFYIIGFLQFVKKNHRFFKALMGDNGDALFLKGIHDYVFVYLERMVTKQDNHKKIDPVRADMLIHYTTNAFIGLLKWWVEKDMPCPTEELGQYVLRQAEANIRESIIK